jgi:L-malate glycosyltransferase
VKILQIIQKPQLRGAELFAAQLSTHLRSAGHDCTILTLFPGEAMLPFEGRIIHLQRPVSTRFFDPQGWRVLAQLIRNEKFDIVQANAADTLKFAVVSKLIFRFHAPIVFRNASMVSMYIRGRLQKWFNNFLYRNTDWILSVTETSRYDLVRLFPVVQDRSSVIYNGINFNNVAVPALSSEPVLLHVGGFSFEKNHLRLIQMFKAVRLKVPAAVLWLVGDGPLRQEVERSVEVEGLGKSVKFFGYVPNPEKYMSSASALVLPSVIEGLPAVVLEAMYYKCPVIAYDVGGIHEVITNGENGVLVPANDEEKFTGAIVEMLEHPDRSIIIRNAYNMVVRKFDNRRVAEQFARAYESLIRKNGHSTR